jgi:D-threo-aldose 1-dehydrogenase
MTDAGPLIEKVPVGRTGPEIDRFVLGCAPLGGLFSPVDEASAAACLDAAWELGVRSFDTAPHYGVGLSEERLGAFLSAKPRDEFVVSTKVGRLLVASEGGVDGVDGFYGTPRRSRVRDYSRDGIRRSLEESLERLGLDRIDIALIHDPDEYGEQALTESYAALHELREEGSVSAIGVGMNQVAMLERFVRETDIDCVLVAGRYSLLDSSAADGLFPLCAARGVSVIAGGVFNSGILADPRPGATFDYRPASAELLTRVEQLRTVCARHGVELASAAIQYVLAHPAVSAVVIGVRSEHEVRENLAHFQTDVPVELFKELADAGLVAPAAGGAR